MSLRKEFVLKALAREAPVAELCREYGISRKTGYKWMQRFRETGLESLTDASRKPDTSPLETSADMTLEVIRLREVHSTWGAKKLQNLLARRFGDEAVPSIRTIGRILKRRSLVRKRRYRRACYGTPTTAPKYAAEKPNDLWTADFKGWWCSDDGARCEPLTVRDAHSRYILDLRLMGRKRYEEVRPAFEELFDRYGLPNALQTDNGTPFACVKTVCGLTRLSAWWVSLGIELVRSRPGCPQDNGAHERMHADVRFELQDKGAVSPQEQQALCDEWRAEFNHVRPHEALGMRTPGEVYVTSSRRLGQIMITSGFPAGCEIRRLNSRGHLHLLRYRVYVSTALSHRQVGLEFVGREIRVWFHHLLLGAFVPGETFAVEPLARHQSLPIILQEPQPEGVTPAPSSPPAVPAREGGGPVEKPATIDFGR